MSEVVVSPEMKEYFSKLTSETEKLYKIAEAARKKG